jgi:phosphatidylglycerol:prolipoprotein diacylglycerol transferase
MLYIFKREGKPITDIDALTLYMVIATVLGARIGHFLFYEPEVLLKNPLEVILPPYRGLASHGATVGILTGLWLYSRRKSSLATKQSFLWVTDRIVIAVALGGCFIRLGNLMNSEIVGRPTDVPWGFVFVNNTEYLQIPRHPAQLYEAISCLFICLFLFWFWNRYKQNTPHGSLLGIFLIGVFGLRFFYEFLKEDQVEFEKTLALNMGQILSIPAVLAGIYLLIVSFRKRPTLPDSPKSR